MSVNGPAKILWLTESEWGDLRKHIDLTAFRILLEGERRAGNASAFGAFDEVTRLRAVCGECGETDDGCGCHLRLANHRSFTGREEWDL